MNYMLNPRCSGVRSRNRKRGFTLAEMAIVVLLIGIMMTMGLGVLKAQTDSAAYSVTNKKQTAIKEALVAYLRANWRLPCPDTNFVGGTAPLVPDGQENRVGAVTTACTANFGVVPYVTLGLPPEMALDGWNNFMSYHVSTAPDWSLTASFNPAAVGSITLNSAPATPLTTNAVAVVVSHGRNGNGAYTTKGSRNLAPTTADELENANVAANLIYFKREFTDVPAAVGGAFDDVVMYLQADDLLTPLRNDGSLKLQQDALVAIQNSVVAQSFAACVLPAAFAPLGQVYGNNVAYTRLYVPAVTLGGPPPTPLNQPLFTLQVGTVLNTILMSQVSGLYASYIKCP